MNDIFQRKAISYNSKSQIGFTGPNVNSEYFVIGSLRYITVKV